MYTWVFGPRPYHVCAGCKHFSSKSTRFLPVGGTMEHLKQSCLNKDFFQDKRAIFSVFMI